jgi:hypothetical protein
MKPKFWKVSHGANYFSHQAVLNAMNDRLVYVHRDTPSKGRSSTTQGADFISAAIGDYFYLTHGNHGIYVLGQFSGPTNILSTMGNGWLDRPYRPIRFSLMTSAYSGPASWWAPNANSTFVAVPDKDIPLFEQQILQPYFGISLANFGI